MKQQRIQMRAHKEMRGLEYLIYSTFSLCLLLVLVLLPLAPVFADEVVPEHTESVVETSSEEENLVTQESVTAVHESADEVETTEVIDIEGDIDAVEGVEISHGSLLLSTQATETTMDVQDEVLVHDVASGNTETHLSEATTTAPTVAHTMSDPVVSDIPLHNEEVLSSTTDIVANDSTNATSTAMAIPEVPLQDVPVRDEVVSTTSEATTSAQNIENVDNVVNVVTNNDNKFSFSKDECTTIGDGTFYCANASLLPEVIHTDRVFSAVDTDGDKEIYVEKAGMLTTLTDNAVDDDAPYFDEVSNTAVWHRLIDGRYQIMEYNFDDETETQVTNDSFNNMQPSVFGDALVWQGWIGNDWEIFLEREGDTKMLTDNTTHDIARV
jgi:hypothetical protein